MHKTYIHTLTSESELSSSASVGALSSLFLCESGWAPAIPFTGLWAGGVLFAKASVLIANFLGASGMDKSVNDEAKSGPALQYSELQYISCEITEHYSFNPMMMMLW